MNLDLSSASFAGLLKKLWDGLRLVPGGKRIFSKILSLVAPYTGSIGPEVQEIGHGYARVSMADRRAVRNHVRSVHAIAVANLGEITSALATMSGLPKTSRGIPIRLATDYLKKARGDLTAECRCPAIEDGKYGELEVEVEIRNSEGDLVARSTVLWKIGPVK